MTTYNPPVLDSGLGIPAQSSDDITARPQPLFMSDDPDAISQSFVVAASQTLAAHTVVGLDANGRLVAATWNATPASRIDPIGVLAEAITTDGTTNYKGVLVWIGGHFNSARLVWDGTFTTQAQKDTVLLKVLGRVKVSTVKTYTP